MNTTTGTIDTDINGNVVMENGETFQPKIFFYGLLFVKKVYKHEIYTVYKQRILP
jgi:hypothetical protein